MSRAGPGVLILVVLGCVDGFDEGNRRSEQLPPRSRTAAEKPGRNRSPAPVLGRRGVRAAKEMRDMVGWRPAIAAGTLAFFVACFGAGASDEQAAADGRQVPDPAECKVAPRSAEQLLELIRSEEASRRTRQEVAYPILLYDAPSDPPVVEEITATARELIACLNAGDPRRAYALYSDQFVRRGADLLPEDVDGPPAPLPDSERVALLEVSYVRPFEDGRVGAVLVIDDPQAPAPAESFFAIFAWNGGHWVLDDLPDPYAVEVEGSVRRVSPDDATPAP